MCMSYSMHCGKQGMLMYQYRQLIGPRAGMDTPGKWWTELLIFIAIHSKRSAVEHNEELHNLYQIYIAENFRPEQLVFVDESACNRITMRRPMAWSHVGSYAHQRDFFHSRSEVRFDIQWLRARYLSRRVQVLYTSCPLAGWDTTPRCTRPPVYISDMRSIYRHSIW